MSDLSAPVRVAVIGAGYFGRFHYDAWSRMPEAELAGICVRHPEAARPVAEEFAINGEPLAIYDNPGEMAASLKPDLVDITAPPAAHLKTIEALAPHVDHIICQKPFCGGLKGAREAIDLCRQHGTRIAVHENIRFQPWYREARRLLDTGILGDIYQISFRLRPGDGQGPEAYLDRQPYFQEMPRFLVHETAIHWIDTFRYLIGETTGVFAHLKKLNPVIAGEDAGVILFDFENGASGVFDGNRLADHVAENRRRTLGEMSIDGSEGTLRLDGDGRLWLRRFGSNDDIEHTFEWDDHLFGGDCVHLCNRHILSSWLDGQDAETEAAAYIRNQEIENAIYESAETGQYLKL